MESEILETIRCEQLALNRVFSVLNLELVKVQLMSQNGALPVSSYKKSELNLAKHDLSSVKVARAISERNQTKFQIQLFERELSAIICRPLE